MTPLAKKVFELFGKPAVTTEQPATPVNPSPEPVPFHDDASEIPLTAVP